MQGLTPNFLQRLFAPEIKTVMLCGCGGGFDFVHSLILYPALRQAGKRVVIGSYSFGLPDKIGGAEIVFREGDAMAKLVTAKSVPDPSYAPEIHMCSFLDRRYPETAPHSIYAYYARAFCVPVLKRFYAQLVEKHEIDAIVTVDGGSDSLMVGDEAGLGDPLEDAVSVATVAALPVKLALLVAVGVGCDRFNEVSDASTLRAIAELTRTGGFLGSVSVEPSMEGFQLYREGLEHIYKGHGRQGFRSVLAGAIVAATEGAFGSKEVPANLQSRVAPGEMYFWPLMAMLWGFDPGKVAERSQTIKWISSCESVDAAWAAFSQNRRKATWREVEDLPLQSQFQR
eukprot:TRINITY_DN8484_c0_g1_i1.p2 TRINITY_DN8484_c0_g1~~TRINITY_DN8484_c0_g1_i1.p2  ORF type:complete len:341 (+),score=56.70 TRINITY_DN8484_c0_g1_i1:1093-2115(+)